MKTIYIVTGYNSFTQKDIRRAFSTEKEAELFSQGLTAPSVNVFKYKSTVELINHFIK